MKTKSESLDKVVSKRKTTKAQTNNEEVNQLTADSLLVKNLSETIESLKKELEVIKSQTMMNNAHDTIPQQYQPNPNIVNTVQPNEYIKVMSLIDNKLNLSTRDHGLGKTFGFEEFGETQDILYSDLMEINNHHRNFLEAGYYYILDDRVVAIASKKEAYKKILTKEQIEKILNNDETAISLFQKANPKQQEVIVKFIIKKIINNEPVDYNLIDKLSRVSGVNIVEKAKASVEIKDNMMKESE
jgi:hypothetical protein